MFNFKGKTVLITGTAQGCGRGIAQAFAEQGANVVMCDVNDEGGKETLALVEAARAKGFYQHADVSARYCDHDAGDRTEGAYDRSCSKSRMRAR